MHICKIDTNKNVFSVLRKSRGYGISQYNVRNINMLFQSKQKYIQNIMSNLQINCRLKLISKKWTDIRDAIN